MLLRIISPVRLSAIDIHDAEFIGQLPAREHLPGPLHEVFFCCQRSNAAANVIRRFRLGEMLGMRFAAVHGILPCGSRYAEVPEHFLGAEKARRNGDCGYAMRF